MTPPGEDPVEPLVLIFGVIGYGIGANVCYTLGWITELTWDGADASVRKLQRQKLFFAGFVLSCALTTLPAGLATFTWMTNILLPR